MCRKNNQEPTERDWEMWRAWTEAGGGLSAYKKIANQYDMGVVEVASRVRLVTEKIDPSSPPPPKHIDINGLEKAVHKLNTAFAAQDLGLWGGPGFLTSTIMELVRHQLGEREMPDGDWDELLAQKPARPRGRRNGYSTHIESAIDVIHKAVLAEQCGCWTPTPRAEALLFMVSLILSGRRETAGI